MCGKIQNKPNCLHFRAELEAIAESPTRRIGAALARHVESCPACRNLLDGLGQVNQLLTQMKWRSMPAGTLALCNRQAMKKLEKRIRQLDKALKLTVAVPDVPKWQKFAIQASRGGMGAAAGFAVLFFNWAATGGLNMTHDQLQQLAQVHQKHHIGNPDNLDDSLA